MFVKMTEKRENWRDGLCWHKKSQENEFQLIRKIGTASMLGELLILYNEPTTSDGRDWVRELNNIQCCPCCGSDCHIHDMRSVAGMLTHLTINWLLYHFILNQIIVLKQISALFIPFLLLCLYKEVVPYSLPYRVIEKIDDGRARIMGLPVYFPF